MRLSSSERSASASPPPNTIKNRVFSGVHSQASRWFKHISDAAEAYKQREGKNRRPEPSLPSSTDLDASDSSVHDKTKENDDSGERGGTPEMAVPGGRSSLEQQDSPPGGRAEGGAPLPAPLPSASSEESAPQPPPAPEPPNASKTIGDGVVRRGEESLRLTTESALIEPSEVLISQRDVLIAEPVLTPLERLRRKDEDIREALMEKQALVADILHVPKEEFENIAELAGEPATDKEASELVLAAVNQANQLSSILNEALQLSEEEAISATSEVSSGGSPRYLRLPTVPAHRLQGISSALNAHLTQLMNIMTERDEERERLRRELQRSREQLHALHEKQNHSGPSVIQEELAPTPSEQTSSPEVFVDALSGEAEAAAAATPPEVVE